jgi:hypothetical protein
VQITDIPIGRIVLDERNPRIAHMFDEVASGANAQDWIPMALGQAAPEDQESGSASTYSSLKASIRAHRGLISPIIVKPDGNGNYIVIEGNTRVAIFRELANDKAPGNWSTISSVVQETIEEEGEHAIRLQAHMVGPRPWRPYAKARYLHDLHTNKSLTILQILDFCGGNARRKEIEDYINAYKDITESYIPLVKAQGGTPDYSRFSSFVELQAIKAPLLRSGHSVADFAQWVHDSRLSPQQMVRQLPRILAHPEASRQFFLFNAREAMKVLDQPAPHAIIGNASLEQLAIALAVKIRQLNWPDVQAMKQDTTQPSVQALLSCVDELKALVEIVGPPADG